MDHRYKKSKRFLSLLIILCIIGSLLAGCGGKTKEDESDKRTNYGSTHRFTIDYEDEDEESSSKSGNSESSQGSDTANASGSGNSSNAGNSSGSSEPAAQTAGDGQPKQLTIQDIQAMNPNSVVIDIYNNEGYLSTLAGKFYEGKVNNVEDGVTSIQGMATLLGLSKGCEFFAVYSEKNEKGYTFYTYQQRYGGYTLQYATLRIIVDPDGYTAGLSCSFVPNIGTASQEPSITKEEAEQLVQNRFASFNLTFYPEHTVRLAVPIGSQVYNCWVVYTNNPEATASFDMPYIEHYVSTDGVYLEINPCNSFATDNTQTLDNSSYFEGMDVKEYSTTLTLQDGSVRNITVPISYNPRDSRYYLMDPSRKIAVAQYYDFNYLGEVNFVSSASIDGWSSNNLLAYANYIIMYDFYASHGIRSIDGFETPILVTVGWCDRNHTPVDNACFYGVLRGWACFGVSDINHYSDCVDVVGHEYTHGVTNRSMQGMIYRNETGAINEAYSDIMGNLAEMSMNYTDDRAWLLAEKTGKVSRDMANPNAYQQPAYVGDAYYVPTVLNPNQGINDYGGVHVNNSLIGHIAYLLNQAGMSYEQQITTWLTSIEILTPKSDYEDLHGALLFSLKINGMLQEFGPALNTAFAEAGLNEDWLSSYLEATKDGYGRVIIQTDDTIAQSVAAVLFMTTSGQLVDVGFPDPNGTVSVLLPAGTYVSELQIFEGNSVTAYQYTGSYWAEYASYGAFNVKSGGVITLAGTSEAPPQQTSTGMTLNLTTLDAGYFTMLMPEGWYIEVGGQYNTFSFRMYDPNNPSIQLFYYGGLAPYHKSVETRNYWAIADPTGIFAEGPVLPQHDILGILSTWSYAIEYQKKYDGKQSFPNLYDFAVNGGAFYTGYYSQFNGIESACYTHCRTDYDNDCRLTITSALVDDDVFGFYGGNWFYTCRDLCGILAPAGVYEDVFEDLLTCLQSLTFSQSYIARSQDTDYAMAPQATITQNLIELASVMVQIRDYFGDDTDASASSELAFDQRGMALVRAQFLSQQGNLSYQRLIDALIFEGFEEADAIYAAEFCGVDWNEKALAAAKAHLEEIPLEYEALISWLQEQGYSLEQAEYAAQQALETNIPDAA